MEQVITSGLKLGIMGGGQLGKMLALAAHSWDVVTYTLDQNSEMPAAAVCSEFVQGDFRDFDTVLRFGKKVDVMTVEIESVNANALEKLEKEGVSVHPSAGVLKIVQDKYLQNEFLKSGGFAKVAFQKFDSKKQVMDSVRSGKTKLPFVQKSRQFGYDGQGVKVIRKDSDLENLFEGPCVTEDLVEIAKEISIVCARNARGDVAVYPPVEMVFDARRNILDYLMCPASLSPEILRQAQDAAKGIIQKLDVVGLLAVEMFVDSKNMLWMNELAPRPHNSAHHTIESCVTSQYEQHLRGIFNFPLGSTKLKMPAVMLNILGEPGYNGPVRYEGFKECLAVEGAKIHIYGKKETRPFRKMGHVTILDEDIESAKRKAALIRQKLRAVS